MPIAARTLCCPRSALLAPGRRGWRQATSTIAHDAHAKAPLFEQTVSDAFYNDQDMVRFFQRVIGYTFMGCPDEDILVILARPGDSEALVGGADIKTVEFGQESLGE